MTTGLFGIARTALLAHQTSLQVVSHNVANAETPGYSRQRPMLSANTPVRMPYGNIGTGVSFDGIERQRDVLLDQSFRSAASLLGESTTRRDLLSQVEGIFGEPADAGMSASLDQFWSAFSDLSASPGSLSAKAVVQQRGKQVAQLFNDYDTQLTQTRNQSMSRLGATVDQVNQFAEQVAELNGRIVTAEATGTVASDLRDQRDLLIDNLSRMVGARTEPQRDGSVSVMVANSTLVDGTSARPLRLELDPPVPPPPVTPSDIPVRLRLGNSVDRLAPLAGEIKGLVDVINKDVPTLRGRLDALASAIVSSVNTAHNTGFVFNGAAIPGTAAGDFFDPGTLGDAVRAGNMTLFAAVASDAANSASSGDVNAPLDNSVALALSALRNNTSAINYTGPNGETETAGFSQFFRTTVTRLGLDVRGSTDDASVRGILVDQADQRRQSVSGVSTDEELIQLMRVQQSYVAATKLIKTADEMLQTILSLV
jgi:flagellar hook-associated protein 1 FlgK